MGLIGSKTFPVRGVLHDSLHKLSQIVASVSCDKLLPLVREKPLTEEFRAQLLSRYRQAHEDLATVLGRFDPTQNPTVKREELALYIGYLDRLFSEAASTLDASDQISAYQTIGDFLTRCRPVRNLDNNLCLYTAWRQSADRVRGFDLGQILGALLTFARETRPEFLQPGTLSVFAGGVSCATRGAL